MNWKATLNLILEYAEYVHWGKLIGFSFLGILLGLLLGIALVFFTKKYIFVERKNKWWKMIAYFWMLGIPLWSAYSGLKYGVILAAEKNVIAVVPEVISMGSKQLDDLGTDDWVNALLTDGGYECKQCEGEMFLELTPNNTIDIGVAIAYDHYYGTLDKLASNDIGVVAKTAELLKGFVSVKVISYFVKKTIKGQLESLLKLNENVSDELLATTFKEYLSEGFVVKITTVLIEDFFASLKKGTLVLFFIILGLPVIEIAIAHYVKGKNNKILEEKNLA